MKVIQNGPKVIQIGPKVIQNRGKVIRIRGKVIRIRGAWPLTVGTKKAPRHTPGAGEFGSNCSQKVARQWQVQENLGAIAPKKLPANGKCRRIWEQLLPKSCPPMKR
jgi:hypothetical protein